MGANRGIHDDTNDRIGRLTNTIRNRMPTNSFAISLVNPAAFLKRIRHGILPEFRSVLTKSRYNNLFQLTNTDHRSDTKDDSLSSVDSLQGFFANLTNFIK